MAGRLPLQIELIDLLGIFSLNQLGQKLKLLAEFENGLLEDCNFPGCPFLEHRHWRYWTYQDLQISLLVEMVNRVKVELNRFLLLFWVRLIHVCLGGGYLQDRPFLLAQSFEDGGVGVVVYIEA